MSADCTLAVPIALTRNGTPAPPCGYRHLASERYFEPSAAPRQPLLRRYRPRGWDNKRPAGEPKSTGWHPPNLPLKKGRSRGGGGGAEEDK
eukprot:2215982-Pyramimonas_sp.AAC.1